MAPPINDHRIVLLAVGIVSITLLFTRRRWQLAKARATSSVLATYDARPAGSGSKPWYQHIIVTHRGVSRYEAVRALHLGSASNPPESIVHLELDAGTLAWVPVAGALEKPHLIFTLLAFAWLDGGFAPDGRACLVGVAGGSLLHYWRACVPGGTTLDVDAVEFDGAVLDAAREHLGLTACEPPHGRCTLHTADGARFLQHAEDESYDLLVIDLDLGALIDSAQQPETELGTENVTKLELGTENVTKSGTENVTKPGSENVTKPGSENVTEPEAPASASATQTAAPSASRRRPRLVACDPTRDMYRVLTSRGVLVINEYSEDPPSRRLESSVRLVRLLRRYFPQVHQLRTNTENNMMLIAPVEPRAVGSSAAEIAERARRSLLGGGHGVLASDMRAAASLAMLLEQAAALPPNRYQVYSS